MTLVGGCVPWVRATVNGANVPAIEKFIVDYTPVTADADDLDENPLYVKRKEVRLRLRVMPCLPRHMPHCAPVPHFSRSNRQHMTR
jgi:hypothetical protein